MDLLQVCHSPVHLTNFSQRYYFCHEIAGVKTVIIMKIGCWRTFECKITVLTQNSIARFPFLSSPPPLTVHKRRYSWRFCWWTGRVHSVGSNIYGQLGIGDRTVEYQFEFRMVEGNLCGRRCLSVGTGTHVSFVVTDKGLISNLYIGPNNNNN